VFLAAGLASHGVDVHCYCHPGTRSEEIPGITFHDVRSLRLGRGVKSGRISHPMERATFAFAATRALRRDRHLYDVVDVRQTAAWEHDVVTVHGVVAALQSRWPAEAGPSFRAARLRAAVAPILRPQIGLDRAIQTYQMRGRRFRRLIAVTMQVRDDLARIHGVPHDVVDIVPPPIDLERIQRARPSGIRSTLGMSNGEPLILFVGHAYQRKGLDRLIEALAGVSNAHLIVVGDGDRAQIMRRIRRANLEQRVHFVGGVDAPERYYAEADLLVLPSRTEPWGIPLIEGMAAGIPVIGAGIAGAAPVVEQSRAGLILPEVTVPALREAVTTLAYDPELRRSMGERGRIAARPFSYKRHAGAVLETYRRAMARPDSGRD
jgi:glycosyltransferase involved in cell wall biosynthesis